MKRKDGRRADQIRKVNILKDYLDYPDGSVFIEMGRTKIICTAVIEEGVPKFLKGKGVGWLTAEYGMLPGATMERVTRDINRKKISGRSQEIQRLIGRSLRAVVDLEKIGERTIWVDCDVIQADGGTRTAAITGGFVAIMIAAKKLVKKGELSEIPIREYLAAVSVGIVDGKPILDLCYEEDSSADVDMNVVMTSGGRFIEVQGTAEKRAFSRDELDKMLKLVRKGIKKLIIIQNKVAGKCWK